MKKNVIISISYSVTLLIGIIVCAICDIVLFGELTWSLIPISSIIFTLIVSISIIIFGKKGIVGSLISFCIFILPYLYLLSELIKVKAVFSIGSIMAIVLIVYLWLTYVILNRLSTRKLIALGIIALVSIPFILIINTTLSRMISEPIIDAWDILTMFIMLFLAATFFISDYAKHKGTIK